MDYEKARYEMVRLQLADRGILDKRLLEVMGQVPRENFLAEKAQSLAYIDSPLNIDSGQTISQPYMLARLLEELKLEGDERVLEIGTGSGYSTALLSLLSREVVSIERDPVLYEKAKANLKDYKNITLLLQDGSLGYPGSFQAIAVHASAPGVPDSLLLALDLGGRMVIPINNNEEERLHLLIKDDQGFVSDNALDFCHFVPLIGKEAYREEEVSSLS